MRRQGLTLGAVLVFLSTLGYAQTPRPFINQPLLPDATAPGGPKFTLTVNGTGFVASSVVNWNAKALATQFIGSSQLKATVPAADIATAGTAWVTVVNPAPGGRSNREFFTVTANIGKSVGFGLKRYLGVGSNPQSVAVGDFNGDGKLDLAVANGYEGAHSGTVSVLLGDGAGNFALASSPAAGGFPAYVAVADFNGDRKADLAVANDSDGTVSILLGDGTGNFSLASSPATGAGPLSIAVGDFNGDGNWDLATANVRDNTVSVLLGDGTGHFTLASSPSVGNNPWSIATGDFNDDGKLDLAVANLADNTVSILLGDGTGHFSVSSSPAVGSSPQSIAAGDFNGDGKLDLAVVDDGSNTVSILLGDGTGNFILTSSPATGDAPFSLALGDFNGDGLLDLAVANYFSSTGSILLGDGTGNFTLASSPPGEGTALSIAVGDFNGDGLLDLATAIDFDAGVVSIVLGEVPPIVLSPTNLSFGTQLINTASDPQSVTLTNVGGHRVVIDKISVGSNFSQTNNCPAIVVPGGQCTINVSFSPLQINQQMGKLVIKDNAPTSPQTVSLTGVGTEVNLQPTSLDFGRQQVGTTSPPQVVMLTNEGQKALAIHHIGIRGQAQNFAQTNNCGTSVPPQRSCSISVTFTPKSAQPKTATLKVWDNGGSSPQTVVLSGKGTR